MFLISGTMKIALPIAELARVMSIPTVLGEGVTRFIGSCEVLGALGIVLPALTGFRPRLTPLAAAALGLVMVLATGYHATRSEFSSLPTTIALGSLAFFVAWGRLRALPPFAA